MVYFPETISAPGDRDIVFWNEAESLTGNNTMGLRQKQMIYLVLPQLCLYALK